MKRKFKKRRPFQEQDNSRSLFHKMTRDHVDVLENIEFVLVEAQREHRDIDDLLDLAVECNIAEKSGAWFTYGKVKLGQGRENAKQFLKDNPELAEEFKHKVLVVKGLIEEPADEKE